MNTSTTSILGSIPLDFPVRPIVLKKGDPLPPHDFAQCLDCGLWWDDSISTSYTPAPSGRCPFEEFHAPDDSLERKRPRIRPRNRSTLKPKSVKALTPTTTYDDGEFVHTAIVTDPSKLLSGTLAVVDKRGNRLCQINLFTADDMLIIDVIDVDDLYAEKTLHSFSSKQGNTRHIVPATSLVSVDFRRKIQR